MSTIANPTAAIIVYSYRDRGGSTPISSSLTEQITITKSIISIDTIKHKSRPAGSFDIKLAPTKNWTAIISPGSWVEIHMSSRIIGQDDLKQCGEDTLKMIGTIDSIRMNVSVDPTTGARKTVYSLQGRDWGSVFESFLYVDTALTNAQDSALVNALNFLSTVDVGAKELGVVGIYSPKEMVEKIINLWGRNMAVLAKNIFKYSQQSKYSIPMGLALKLSSKSPYAADNINVISGKLISKDVYVPVKESLGVLNPLMLLGPHAVWQLLMAHSNNILNELVAELRWQGPFPDFALYHRIKPFQVKSNKPAYFASNFFNIKQNKIPTYDIMGIEAGDNTQDIVNFIEILPDMSLASLPASVSNGIIAASKPDSSIIDPASLARHGLKPLTYSSVFAPSAGGYLNWLGVKDWLPILRDWYFDCHKMLNGTVVILGQEKYIGVGENIVLDSSVFGNANFVNADKTKFVAHVESVSHSFAYEPQRGRTFVTRINFVRGVFADSSASKLANPNAFGIETDSSALPDSKKDIDNVYLE